MKRLTKRLEDEQAVMDCTGCPESWNTNPVGKCTALYCRNMLKDRLAAIEDILGDEYELDNIAHIRHAAKAESEISATGLMCTACHSDTDADAVYCKYCGARLEG